MSSAPAYGPAVEERPRDPLRAEWALRGAIALVVFAGFFAFGKSTAPAGEGEARPTVVVSTARQASRASSPVAERSPLEGAFAERASLERAEVARAEALARARRRSHRPAALSNAAVQGFVGSGTGAAEGARTEPVRSSAVTSPVTTSAPRKQASPAPLPHSTSSRGSSGPGTSFYSSE